MMYASSKTHLVQKLDVAGKVTCRHHTAIGAGLALCDVDGVRRSRRRGRGCRPANQMIDVRKKEELTDDFLYSKLAFYK